MAHLEVEVIKMEDEGYVLSAIRKSFLAKKFVEEYVPRVESLETLFSQFVKDNVDAIGDSKSLMVLVDLINFLKLKQPDQVREMIKGIITPPKTDKTQPEGKVAEAVAITDLFHFLKSKEPEKFVEFFSKLAIGGLDIFEVKKDGVRMVIKDLLIFLKDKYPEKYNEVVYIFNPKLSLPEINSMDFFKDPKAVKEFIEAFDARIQKIYRIKLDTPILHRLLNTEDFEGVWMAGSKSLESFIKLLNHYLTTKVKYDIKANDTDIFFLNSDKDYRMQFEDVDIIKSTKKDVVELITSFDLAPCQIAINCKNEVVLTAHCLYAILTGKYYLHTKINQLYICGATGGSMAPEHIVKDTLKFIEGKLGDEVSTLPSSTLKNKIKKIQFRIMKYVSRGFTPTSLDDMPTDLVAVFNIKYFTQNPYAV